MYRQGDVLLIPVQPIEVSRLNKVPLEDGKIVLAHGEQTGHSHVLVADDAELVEEQKAAVEEAKRYLRVGMAGGTLVHEEHGAISVPSGMYEVRLQKEFNPDTDNETVPRANYD